MSLFKEREKREGKREKSEREEYFQKASTVASLSSLTSLSRHVSPPPVSPQVRERGPIFLSCERKGKEEKGEEK